MKASKIFICLAALVFAVLVLGSCDKAVESWTAEDYERRDSEGNTYTLSVDAAGVITQGDKSLQIMTDDDGFYVTVDKARVEVKSDEWSFTLGSEVYYKPTDASALSGLGGSYYGDSRDGRFIGLEIDAEKGRAMLTYIKANQTDEHTIYCDADGFFIYQGAEKRKLAFTEESVTGDLGNLYKTVTPDDISAYVGRYLCISGERVGKNITIAADGSVTTDFDDANPVYQLLSNITGYFITDTDKGKVKMSFGDDALECAFGKYYLVNGMDFDAAQYAGTYKGIYKGADVTVTISDTADLRIEADGDQLSAVLYSDSKGVFAFYGVDKVYITLTSTGFSCALGNFTKQ